MAITIRNVYDTMSDIALHIQNQGTSFCCPYIQQREIIKSTFANGVPYSESCIIRRLIVIDSLYSTNANFNYFSIEEMAAAIYSIGPNEQNAIDYFERIANGGKDSLTIFSSSYGIRKNTLPGNSAMSLLSKYAYYLLLNCTKNPLGFPIYDSMAKEIYPIIIKQTIGKRIHKTDINKYSVEEYIKDLNILRDALFGNKTTRLHGMQQFDALDAYLWRVGKVKSGNFSLLFTKSEYITFINNLQLTGLNLKSNLFDKEVAKQCNSMTSVAILQGIYTYPSAMHTLIDHCRQI